MRLQDLLVLLEGELGVLSVLAQLIGYDVRADQACGESEAGDG